MKLYKQAHTVYKTQYHIAWITRYRRKILQHGIEEYFKLLIREVQKFFPDIIIITTIGTDLDHVHIHVVIPPKYAVSKIVEAIKSNTSHKMKEKFLYLRKVYWDEGGIWAAGFFVSTAGINEEIIKNYVKMQGEHDSGQLTLEL